MSDQESVSINFEFSRYERYRTIWRTLPYILSQGIRKEFRSTPQAQASTAELAHPEFHRVVHDVYCDMFIRGYRQSTGYPVERSTGLAVVLFAVFMYVFDDEFEVRRRRGDAVDVNVIINSPAVFAIWHSIGSYLTATGRGDEVRRHILNEFFAPRFDGYCEDVREAAASTNFAVTRSVVEFDSGEVLGTVYNIIRLYNDHPYHDSCASEFRNLGLAGKFMDDMADYTDDVKSGNPNLLDALAAEQSTEFAAARAALAAGGPVTMQWWREHCPVTHERYFQWISRYYSQVRTPGLRLPLDIYLALLGTRKFWTVSTVRASRSAS